MRAVLRLSAPLAIHSGLLLLSPRVEYLVVAAFLGDREKGLFLAALQVFWFLGMVPSAIAAGAMPSLTREAMAGRGPVRQRTAGLLAALAAPAAVGLALVAPALVATVFGADYLPAAPWLRVLAAGVPALFLNALATAALVAAGRAAVLPRITAVRVGVAFAVALVAVPRFGVPGAAAGLVAAEWLLLALGVRACAAASFEVHVVRPLGLGAPGVRADGAGGERGAREPRPRRGDRRAQLGGDAGRGAAAAAGPRAGAGRRHPVSPRSAAKRRPVVLYQPSEEGVVMPLGLLALGSWLSGEHVVIVDGRFELAPESRVVELARGALCLGVTVAHRAGAARGPAREHGGPGREP